MTSSLTIEDLTTGYISGIAAVHSVSLSVPAGRITGLIGRNGAGKTTIAAATAGVIPAWSGRIRMDDWDCTRASTRERVTRGLVTVPENRRLFGQLSVAENLKTAAYAAKRRIAPSLRTELEEQFPVLRTKADVRAGALSGGEQQMVALARARVMQPAFVLLDEPSLGLSPAITKQLAGVIQSFADDGIGVLLIEQNMGLIESVCDEVQLLDQGRIQRTYTVGELSTRESIVAAYLGVTDTTHTETLQPAAPRTDVE